MPDKPPGRVYDTAEWKRVRSVVLAEEPTCRMCGEPATDVDHRRAIERGGAPYDRDNLQALCHSCHSRLTAALDGGFGNGKGAKGKGSGPAVEVAELDAFIDALRALHPHVVRPGNSDLIRRLASFYRMIAFHGARLEIDPGDSYSTDLYQKLSILALRHEAALGIGKPSPQEAADELPRPIRRR